MGLYSAATIPNSIAPGDTVFVWGTPKTASGDPPTVGETPTPGVGGVSASLQVALANPVSGSNSISFHGQFSGAPGGFEVDCQVSDRDIDADYQTLSGLNITTVDATNQTFHAESVTSARFARMLMRTRANSVTIIGSISR